MMRFGATVVAVLLAGTAVHAGALDRSGGSVGALFDAGNVVELSFGRIMPQVSGSVGGGAVGSGNMAVDYATVGLSIKTDVTEDLSFALILDRPFGADIAYDSSDAGYPLAGSSAQFRSQGMTALVRYRLSERFSIHGGLRSVSIDADLTVASPGGTYVAEFDRDTDAGYVVGAAFAIPDIALRVALTYASELAFSNTTRVLAAPGVFVPVADTDYTMPQQVTLDFQTGIAENTLLFGSIRWADWSETEISPALYPRNPVVDYDNDFTTYTVGIGRRFSEAFAGALSVTYEEQTGDPVSDLGPTDGELSLQVGGTYTMGDVDLTAGVRYVMIGDATTRGAGAEFSDNSALAVGMSVAYRF